jgi:aminoglycoside phosphotransferase (APT) family kinase protein
MQTDGALEDLAVLLRRYHQTAGTFTPPESAQWRRWVGSAGGPIIRHGDLWPANVVFRSGKPVALIDWEFAQPGTPLDDLASAAKHWVPLISDERAVEEGWHLPLGRPRRLRLLCDAYGLDLSTLPELVARVIRNADLGYWSHKAWGEARIPGFEEMWQNGSGDEILSDQRWLREHQHELLEGV